MAITPPPLIPELPPAPQRHQMPVDYAITADTWASAWGNLTGQVNGLTDWMNGVGLLAMQYSSETEQWRNETLGYRNAAQTSATNAAASEVAAKKHLDDTRELINNFDITGDLPAASIKNAPLVVATDQGGVRFSDRALNNGAGVRPALRFDFANQGYLDPRIEFTRASVDWDEYGNEYGIDKPVLTDKGLWVSGARTNLMTASSLLTQPPTNAEFVPSREVAEGVIRLGFLKESLDTGSQHYIRTNNISRTLGESYRESLFVGKGSTRHVYVFSNSLVLGGNTAMRFDPITASIALQTNIEDPAVEDIGFAWRVSFTVSAVSNGAQEWRIYLHNGSSFNYEGDGESGAYIGSFQSEVGTTTTPYIPTENSQVTVAATRAITQRLPLSTSGAITFSALCPSWQFYNTLIGSGSSVTEEVRFQLGGSRWASLALRADGVNAHINTPPDFLNIGNIFKGAFAFEVQANGSVKFKLFVNGLLIGEHTLPRLPNGFLTEGIAIGRRIANDDSLYWGESISSIAYFNKLLTDEHLQELTTL